MTLSPHMHICAPVVLLLAALAGCAGSSPPFLVERNEPVKPPAPVASEPDGGRTPVVTTGPGTAPSVPTATGRVSNDKAIEVKVKGGGKVPLLTSILPKHCSTVVEPFDIKANAVEFAFLMGKAALEIAAEAAKEKTKGKSKGKSAELKSRLSNATRAEAMRLNWLPQSFERRYGEYLLREAERRGQILPRNADTSHWYTIADELLGQLVSALPPNEYQFRIFVRKSAGTNATALPGGIIFIDSTLLEKKDLARFSIAHELSHVLKRHQTRLLQSRIFDAISITSNFSESIETIRDSSEKSVRFFAALSGGKLLFTRHFAFQELDSDACSVRIMAMSSDIDELHRSVEAFDKAMPAVDAYEQKQQIATPSRQVNPGDVIDLVVQPIDSHPTPKDRRANLAEVRADVLRSVKAAPRLLPEPAGPRPTQPRRRR